MKLELEFPVNRCDTFEDSKILFDQISSVVCTYVKHEFTNEEIQDFLENNNNPNNPLVCPYGVFVDLENKMPDLEFIFGVLMEYVVSPIKLLSTLAFINGGKTPEENKEFVKMFNSSQKRLIDCLK